MSRFSFSALVVFAWSIPAVPVAAQDVAAGKTAFNKCVACHAVGEGARTRVGPQLNGLNGRKAGTAPDFIYSAACKNSGVTWNEAEFREYMRDPRLKIPGTKMAFAGIKSEKEIYDLWAFLSQFDGNGKIKQ